MKRIAILILPLIFVFIWTEFSLIRFPLITLLIGLMALVGIFNKRLHKSYNLTSRIFLIGFYHLYFLALIAFLLNTSEMITLIKFITFISLAILCIALMNIKLKFLDINKKENVSLVGSLYLVFNFIVLILLTTTF